MTLVDYWDVIRRRLGLIAFVVLLGGLAVLVAGRPSAPGATTYGGSALLAVDNSVETSQVLYLDFVAQQTSAILDTVVAQIDPGEYGEADVARIVAGSVSTKPNADIGVLQIEVDRQPSEEQATQLLTLYGQAIIDFAADAKVRQRDDALAAVEARISGLESQISGVQAQVKSAGGSGANGIEDPVLQAQLSTLLTAHASAVTEAEDLRTKSPSELSPVAFIGGPRVVANAQSSDPLGLKGRLALGLVAGLLVGVGLAFAIHRFDRRIYNRRDAETGFQLPVLAEIPAIPYSKRRRFQLIAQQEPTAPASEAYRVLRSSVDHARARQLHGEGDRTGAATVVLVTAASERVGTSTTVANLAVASVYAGKKVLIVAADLRRPTIHHYFRVEHGPGLADFVDDRWRSKAVDFASYVQNTVVPDVSLIHHGREVISAGETVAAAGPLIEAARSRFDVVLIDSPPMQAGSDVNELVGFADLVLLVCRIGRSTTDDGELALELTERLQAPTCGLALVGIRSTFRHSAAGRLLRASVRRASRSSSSRTTRSASPADPVESAAPVPAPSPAVPEVVPAVEQPGAMTQMVGEVPWPWLVERDPYGASRLGGPGMTVEAPPGPGLLSAPGDAGPASPQRPRQSPPGAPNGNAGLNGAGHGAEVGANGATGQPAPSNGAEPVPPSGGGPSPAAGTDAMRIGAVELVDEDELGPAS